MTVPALPPELIARIVSYLAILEDRSPPAPYFAFQKPSLHAYASVSPIWQSTIEKRNFASLRLTSDDTSTLEKLLVRFSHRRAALASVSFEAILPSYDDFACARFEREADQRVNNEAFGNAIAGILGVLQCCEDVAGTKPVELTIEAPRAPTDADPEGKRQAALELGQRRDLFDRRYAHSYLTLPRELPSLRRVTRLRVVGDERRRISPTAAAGLLKHFPNLEDAGIRLSDEERKSPELRRTLRMDFGETLISFPTASLTTFRLDYRCEGPSDQRFINADVRGPQAETHGDSFSAALGSFLRGCQNLRSISLDGPICADGGIFAPSDERLHHKIETFGVNLSLVRPDGGWYFDKDPEEPLHEATRQELGDNGDDDDDLGSETSSDDGSASGQSGSDGETPDEFRPHIEAARTGDRDSLAYRTQPTAELEHLLEAAARGAQSMPNLQRMAVGMDILACPRTDWETQAFEFTYIPAKASPDGVATLQWTAPRDWRMSAGLEGLWKSLLGSEGRVDYEEW